MKTVVKKWIPQYGVTVRKNSKIYDFVESRFNIEKEVVSSKRNLLVLFYSETYYHDWVIQVETFCQE